MKKLDMKIYAIHNNNQSGEMITVPSNEKASNMEFKTKENADPSLPVKGNNLEDVLNDLKLSGRYHLMFLFLIGFVIMMSAPFTLHYIFSAEAAMYGCKYSDCSYTELATWQENSTLDFKCRKYELFEQNGTCTEDNFDTSTFTECSEWVYEDPKTFVAEFDLGCKDGKRTLVGTMHSAGFMFGLLIIGPMSDKFGRKKILIFSTLFSAVIGVSKSMVKTYWIFIALETIEPILGDSYSTGYTMVAEMTTTKNRPVIVFLFASADALGSILMATLAYLAPSWRILLISLYAPAFIFILYIFALDESPRWLLIKGRKAEAEKILKKAAKMNKTVIDESKFVNLKCEETSSIDLREALRVTFSSRKLLVRLLLCFSFWFTALFNSYALLINAVSLEGDKYINYGLVSLCGVVGGIILTFVLTKFKRKIPLILALALTGAFCISQSFVPKGYRWVSLLLYLCGKTCVSVTIKMVYLYTTELFPTYTRNTMLAICSAVGRIGSILAPLTPLLMVYWENLPAFLVGVLSLVTAIIVTMMPDTSKNALPDNVEEAEDIGIEENEKDQFK